MQSRSSHTYQQRQQHQRWTIITINFIANVQHSKTQCTQSQIDGSLLYLIFAALQCSYNAYNRGLNLPLVCSVFSTE